MEILNHIGPVLAGLVSGVIGSLIAPWVHWGIESRRERRSERVRLLADARAILAEPPPMAVFRRMPIYFRVLPHLSDETRAILAGRFDDLGNEVVVVAVGGAYGGVNPYAHRVLGDLARLEQEWRLV